MGNEFSWQSLASIRFLFKLLIKEKFIVLRINNNCDINCSNKMKKSADKLAKKDDHS